jgi:hypothetical protein
MYVCVCVCVCRYYWKKPWKKVSEDPEFQNELQKLHNGEYTVLCIAELNEGV